MELFTGGLLSIAGILIGAGITYLLSIRAQRDNSLIEARNEAYSDYIRGVASLAARKSEEGKTIVADAKARIAIYGTSNVIAGLSQFDEVGATLASDKGQRAFLEVVLAMRKGSNGMSDSVEQRDIYDLLFGSKPFDGDSE